MTTLLIAAGAFVLYLVAYHTYGKWLARKLFRLDATAKVPSIEQEDGVDFVPSDKKVIFGHHFTSIAGTGPIVGPALAVIWGWVPALIWVLFGSILIGAVHDLGALVISMRNRGQTIGDIAGRVVTRRTRILFLTVLFLALTIVLAVFGLVIAAVFRMYPESIFPCLLQVPLAVIIGIWIHRKGINLLLPSLIALALMLLSVAYGNVGSLGDFNASLASWGNLQWCAVLLGYCVFASILPVWILLQPRDYINALQLLFTLGLIVLGLVVAAFWGGAPVSGDERQSLEIVAPAFNWSPDGAPAIFPFLFITIACGAISGFHCLVSSGTSSKQIKCETDAQFIGYGSMLTEGFLAVLVILACVAGLGLGTTVKGDFLTGESAFQARYHAWSAAQGLPAKIGAFVDGSANFLKALGVEAKFAVALMGVFVASFAATTLDTACRLQRYVVQELAVAISPKQHPANPLTWLSNRYGATLFAVFVAYFIARLPSESGALPGTGGMILWPLFGAVNQLLAGLAFLVITFWLRRRGLPFALTLIPGVVMLVLPAIAMSMNLRSFAESHNWLLFTFGFVTLLIEAWMIGEAISVWNKTNGILEEAPEIPSTDPEGGRSC